MGSENISFELDGNKPFADVLKEFKRLQAENADYNGHREGYSGDWQTIHGIENQGYEVFASEDKAQDYCLGKTEKREAIAVKYLVKESIKPDAKLKRLRERLAKLETERREYATACNPIRDGIYTAIKAKPYHTCRHCKSRVNTEYFTRAYCPVCNSDVIQAKHVKRFASMLTKVQALQAEITAHLTALDAKAKVKDTRWLVAGWAAC